MTKIVIIGSPGAGKSTLAREIGHILKIDPIHLDHHFWRRGWKEYSRKRRIKIEQRLIRKKHDKWIIEGSYLSSSDNRLQAADTIIFLDTPFLLCLRRVIIRHRKELGRKRSDIPRKSTDKLDWLRIAKIICFPLVSRNWLLGKIKKLEKQSIGTGSEKTVIIIQSSKELEAFLSTLKQPFPATKLRLNPEVPQYA